MDTGNVFHVNTIMNPKMTDDVSDVHVRLTPPSIVVSEATSYGIHKTRTLPSNLNMVNSNDPLCTDTQTHNLELVNKKTMQDRFRLFRRASAVRLEELAHGARDNNGHRRGSSLDVDIQKSYKRRFSFTDIFHRRGSSRKLSSGNVPKMEESEISLPNHLNERISVWFADSPEDSYHDLNMNSMYEMDGLSHNPYFTSAFGHQGKAKGDFQDAKDVALLAGDRILITDLILSRVNLYNKNGRLLLIYTGSDLFEPWSTVGINNNQIAVTSRRDHCVRIFSLEGEIMNSFGENLFKFPAGFAVDRSGNFIVCDAETNKVSMHSASGSLIRFLGDSEDPEQRFKTPRYVCVNNTGEIIVSDSGNHQIKMFTPSGDFIRSFGGFGSGVKQMKFPYGVCTNDHGYIFVADHYNNRISMFTRDGEFLNHIVSAEHGLHFPQALTIDSDMKLYVSHGKLKANEILIFDLHSSRIHHPR